jgi:hypothetical protein
LTLTCGKFWANAFFIWGPYAAFHEMAVTCQIEGSVIMNTSADVSKFNQFMLNVEYFLKYDKQDQHLKYDKQNQQGKTASNEA